MFFCFIVLNLDLQRFPAKDLTDDLVMIFPAIKFPYNKKNIVDLLQRRRKTNIRIFRYPVDWDSSKTCFYDKICNMYI